MSTLPRAPGTIEAAVNGYFLANATVASSASVKQIVKSFRIRHLVLIFAQTHSAGRDASIVTWPCNAMRIEVDGSIPSGWSLTWKFVFSNRNFRIRRDSG